MNSRDNGAAFGAPGIEPRWTSSAKEGVGTAYHTSCRVWCTLSHGIVNEIYYPHIDQPNTGDFQFLISDGETFCHEEKRDLNHLIEYPLLLTLRLSRCESPSANQFREAIGGLARDQMGQDRHDTMDEEATTAFRLTHRIRDLPCYAGLSPTHQVVPELETRANEGNRNLL